MTQNYEKHKTHWYTCPECGKRTFHTRKAAKAAIRSLKNDGSRKDTRPSDIIVVYECGTGFHIGHTKGRLRYEKQSRTD